MKFQLPPDEHRSQGQSTKVHVIGAGGTGSAFLAALVKLAQVSKAVGLPTFDVTVWDDDTVSSSNIGRQVFAPADIGRCKATVLVNRINLTYGLGWEAMPRKFNAHRCFTRHFLIGCVDTRAARAEINRHYRSCGDAIWIDCGNSQASGQVVMGARLRHQAVLPSSADLFPEVTDAAADDGDDAPSCSVSEAIARQDPMINQMIADYAANLLWRLVRFGEVQAHGAFIDAESFTAMPMPVDESYWSSLGWQRRRPVAMAA